MAVIYHGILLLFCVILIPNILNKIPLSYLAAILIVVDYKLAKPTMFRDMFKQRLSMFLPFVVTIMAIMLSDLLKGIIIGLVVGVFYVLKANIKVPYVYRRNEENKDGSKNVEILLSANMTFLNEANIQNTLVELPSHSTIIIDGSKTHNFDKDVLEILHEFRISAKEKNIKVKYVNLPTIDLTLGITH